MHVPYFTFWAGRLLHLPITKAVVSVWPNDDDDDDEGRINFSVALGSKTTRTCNNKLKQ